MTINGVTAQKLGEVLAFCQVGIETLKRGQKALDEEFGPDTNIQVMINDLDAQAAQIKLIADEAGIKEVAESKAGTTGNKLRSMRDLNVGEEWDNATELFEWLGFFEGAAIVHWQLVVGAAESLQDSRMSDLAQDGLAFHRNLLSSVEDQIKLLGHHKTD